MVFGGGSVMRSGAAIDPIELPALDTKLWPWNMKYLIGMDDSGKLWKLSPSSHLTDGSVPGADTIVTGSDQFLGASVGGGCFPQTQVCDCDFDYLAGLQAGTDGDGNPIVCLVRTDKHFRANAAPDDGLAIKYVANLPDPSTVPLWSIFAVTDASAPVKGDPVIGGGVVKTLVFSDHFSWIVV
jgi:hypothetical protein